jgi:hypothetical protein
MIIVVLIVVVVSARVPVITALEMFHKPLL